LRKRENEHEDREKNYCRREEGNTKNREKELADKFSRTELAGKRKEKLMKSMDGMVRNRKVKQEF
jgi:hypothetical protein